MGAVVYNTLKDLMDNLVFQCTVSSDLSELSGVIHDYSITHDSITELPITTTINNLIVKSLTGCVVATQTDLNCYPVGLNDTLCFDSDGNLLP